MNKNSIFYKIDQKVDKIIKIIKTLSIIEYSNTFSTISKNNLQNVLKKLQIIIKFVEKSAVPIVIEPILPCNNIIEQCIKELYKLHWMVFGTGICSTDIIQNKSIRTIDIILDIFIHRFKNYGVLLN